MANTESTVTVTRTAVAGGKFSYTLHGMVNGETYGSTPDIAASKVYYTHAALTQLTDCEVLSYHKTAAAAGRGNPSISRKYHRGVRVVEITG